MSSGNMRGSVLMVGCLFWEDETQSPDYDLGLQKRKWRSEVLTMDQAVLWPAPIRYGMQSPRRWSTFTMVFSASAGSGWGKLVPFQCDFSTPQVLLDRASHLGQVEGYGETNSLWSDWGAVALAWNPERLDRGASYRSVWQKAFTEFTDANRYRIGSENSCMDAGGFFRLPLTFPEHLDFILVTPNIPNVPQYPDAQEVERAVRASGLYYDTYVRENIRHGIRGIGDEWMHLKHH